MTKKRKVLSIILIVLITATVAFIWSNSMRTKTQSAEQSGTSYSFFKVILDFIFGEGVITHDVFRKLAHGIEFFVLGLELNLLLITVKGFAIKRVWMPLVSGLFVAVMDECIQILAKRGASVIDVLIDFGGVLTATLITSLIAYLIIKKRKGRKS